MCKGKKDCILLKNKNFPKKTILPVEDWLYQEVETFYKSSILYSQNKKIEAIKLFKSIDSKKIFDYCELHGQSSGHKRIYMLNKKIHYPKYKKEDLFPIRSPIKIENEVFERDNYHCRYCGIRLFSKSFLKSGIFELGQNGKRNIDRHGIYMITFPVADHVHPWTQKGETTIDNLVSSCGPCNYGKNNYTIKDLEIQNPFENPIQNKFWDGGLSILSLK